MSQELANVPGGAAPRQQNAFLMESELGYAQDAPLFNIDLRGILSAIRRNLIAFIAIVLGALLIGVVLTVLAVPQYVATSRVLVELTSDGILEEETVSYAAVRDTQRFIQTQVDILNSFSMAERVVESEGLAESAEFYAAMGADMPTQESMADRELGPEGIAGVRQRLATNLLLAHVEAAPPLESGIVSISVSSSSAAQSAEIANAYAANYIEIGRAHV